jgi:mono/diheme cytochrome c family protein
MGWGGYQPRAKSQEQLAVERSGSSQQHFATVRSHQLVLLPTVRLCEMTRSVRFVFVAIIAVATSTSATAAETPVHLKPGAGLDKVETNCGVCHSLDYVPMNSPFLNAAGWDAEVSKMVSAFGAQIDKSDATAISDYLNQNYGPTPPPTPPSPKSPRSGAPGDGLFPPLLKNNAARRAPHGKK